MCHFHAEAFKGSRKKLLILRKPKPPFDQNRKTKQNKPTNQTTTTTQNVLSSDESPLLSLTALTRHSDSSCQSGLWKIPAKPTVIFFFFIIGRFLSVPWAPGWPSVCGGASDTVAEVCGVQNSLPTCAPSLERDVGKASGLGVSTVTAGPCPGQGPDLAISWGLQGYTVPRLWLTRVEHNS